MNNNILITSAGKRVVLVQIFQKTLKELGSEVKVYTVDANPEMAPACMISDGYFKVPRCTVEGYIDELIRICRDQQIGILIPTIDTELLVLAQNVEKLKKNGIALVESDEDFIKICRDKRQIPSFFSRLGIQVPQLVDKQHPTYPLFAKPYDGSLSSNTHLIRCQEEMTQEIMNDPKMLFMECVDKNDYREFSVDMYYGKDHHVKSIVPRERIEIRAGEINKGVTRKNYIVGYLKQRMDYLPGVRGCICLQLFYREKDNNIKGIEINPRFGGGFPLTYHARANYAEYIIREYLLNESMDYSDNWLDNMLMLRYDADIIIYDGKEKR